MPLKSRLTCAKKCPMMIKEEYGVTNNYSINNIKILKILKSGFSQTLRLLIIIWSVQ